MYLKSIFYCDKNVLSIGYIFRHDIVTFIELWSKFFKKHTPYY